MLVLMKSLREILPESFIHVCRQKAELYVLLAIGSGFGMGTTFLFLLSCSAFISW